MRANLYKVSFGPTKMLIVAHSRMLAMIQFRTQHPNINEMVSLKIKKLITVVIRSDTDGLRIDPILKPSFCPNLLFTMENENRLADIDLL